MEEIKFKLVGIMMDNLVIFLKIAKFFGVTLILRRKDDLMSFFLM